jgi:hypothetical protein
MGNKARRTCSACSAVFKDKGASQQRCPQCAAALGVRQQPAASKSKRGRKRPLALADDTQEFFAALDARTVLISELGPAFEAALACIGAASVIAVDTEGVALSRTGQLTLLQVAVEERVFLFDILALGAAAFGEPPACAAGAAVSLHRVLQGAAHTKLAWDVRRDSDALLHQFGVRLCNVLDVQLAAIAARRAAGENVATLPGLPQTAKRFLDKVRQLQRALSSVDASQR